MVFQIPGSPYPSFGDNRCFPGAVEEKNDQIQASLGKSRKFGRTILQYIFVLFQVSGPALQTTTSYNLE